MKVENTQGNLIIGEGVQVTGNIVCPGLAKIDGILHGSLSTGQLQVGSSGRIDGEVVAGVAVVQGEVKPSLICRDKLVICSTGKVMGSIEFQQLEVELGGQLVGKILSTPEPAALELTDVTLLSDPSS